MHCLTLLCIRMYSSKKIYGIGILYIILELKLWNYYQIWLHTRLYYDSCAWATINTISQNNPIHGSYVDPFGNCWTVVQAGRGLNQHRVRHAHRARRTRDASYCPGRQSDVGCDEGPLFNSQRVRVISISLCVRARLRLSIQVYIYIYIYIQIYIYTLEHNCS